MRLNSLCSVIYVTFDDPKMYNSLKGRRLCGELKDCAQIAARTKMCTFKKGESTAIAEENNPW